MIFKSGRGDGEADTDEAGMEEKELKDWAIVEKHDFIVGTIYPCWRVICAVISFDQCGLDSV